MGETGHVAFIGLGNIGLPMAGRLLGWPGGLRLHDVRREAAADLVQQGAVWSDSPRDAADGAVAVSIMVQNEAQVRSVLEGANGVLAAAGHPVILVHSTISPGAARELAGLAAASGFELLDAPVSGGAGGAKTGELALLVGGSAAAMERALPVMELMGAMVRRFGDVGAGTEAKLARNLVTFVSYAATGEAIRLAGAAGIDIRSLGDVVRHTDRLTGGPGAVMLRSDAEPWPADNPIRPIFEHSLALGLKDLELAAELGRGLGVELPLSELARGSLASALGVDEPS